MRSSSGYAGIPEHTRYTRHTPSARPSISFIHKPTLAILGGPSRHPLSPVTPIDHITRWAVFSYYVGRDITFSPQLQASRTPHDAPARCRCSPPGVPSPEEKPASHCKWADLHALVASGSLRWRINSDVYRNREGTAFDVCYSCWIVASGLGILGICMYLRINYWDGNSWWR